MGHRVEHFDRKKNNAMRLALCDSVLERFHHGDFIAVREFNTDDAVRPDF
jgi:hypothetical protein